MLTQPPSHWTSRTDPFVLAAGQIHLYLLLSADYQSQHNSLLGILSEQEKLRAERKKIPAKQFEYILGQAALRSILAQTLSIAGAEVSYARGPKGKPYLDPVHQRQDLQFNISHSGGLLLIALSTGGEIGVDIEAINTTTSMDLVSRRTFSETENETLFGLPDTLQREQFFQYWTCKEAVVKCTGDGIHSGMNQFTVVFPNSGGALLREAHGRQEKTRNFSITPLDLGPTHKGALVCVNPVHPLHHHYLEQLPI